MIGHFLFPQTCMICGTLGVSACHECLKGSLNPLQARCIQCGKPFPCGIHPDSIPVFSGNIHEGICREMILHLKYRGRSSLGEVMGKALASSISLPENADYLVPIPLHSGSKRKFNQSLLIAKGIQKELGILVLDSLKWKVSQGRQVNKDPVQRKQMPQDVFRISLGELKGKRIILVDDVITTGTTLNRAVRFFRRNGSFPVAAITWTASL